MDKSKLIAIGALLALGGLLLFSKMRDPALPPSDDDDHDHDPQPTAVVKQAAPSTSKTPLAPGTAPATDPQVPVTELKIIDERVGTGPVAKIGDQLSMNYRGTLLNGAEFDSSYGRAPFDVAIGTGQVIKGWDQGIPGMKVGGKRKLIIPAELAYGERSPSEKIPANSPLQFEVELLSVNGKTS